MKRLLSFTLIFAATIAAFAQNEQIHVFRNDNNFSTYKSSGVTSITYDGSAGAWTKMVITETDGTATSIDLSKIDSCVLRPTGLPEFYITLTDYPNVAELTDAFSGVAKDTEFEATMRMEGNGMYDDVKEQHVIFRGRGNSTWNMRKKPYRFKMDKKAKVCGLPKAKSFALIANNIDCSLMRNTVALWVSNYFEMPFANHCVPCKVYLNGNYKGQYMLTEKIGVGGGSVDIDEYKGMLFELDSNYDENFKFEYTWSSSSSSSGSTGGWGGRPGGSSSSYTLPVMCKDPDLTEIVDSLGTTTTAYWQKWQTDFTTMAKAITSRATTESLSDVIDLESAVNFFFVNDLACNHEMKHPKSFYLYKESLDAGQVYHFGPTWDFDWAFTFDGNEGEKATNAMVSVKGDKNGYEFIKALCANEEFRTLFKKRLDDFVATGYPELIKYMDQYAALIEPSAKENGLLWPSYQHASWCVVTSSYDFRSNYETLKKWIADRIAFMQSDSNFGLYN